MAEAEVVAEQGKSPNSSPFAQRVYRLCRQIPTGRVTTYKEIARALETGAFRAVGQALRHNPAAPQVPCHRVVKSDGRLGGFCGSLAKPAVLKKKKLLQQEGIEITKGRVVEMKKRLYRFSKDALRKPTKTG